MKICFKDAFESIALVARVLNSFGTEPPHYGCGTCVFSNYEWTFTKGEVECRRFPPTVIHPYFLANDEHGNESAGDDAMHWANPRMELFAICGEYRPGSYWDLWHDPDEARARKTPIKVDNQPAE